MMAAEYGHAEACARLGEYGADCNLCDPVGGWVGGWVGGCSWSETQPSHNREPVIDFLLDD